MSHNPATLAADILKSDRFDGVANNALSRLFTTTVGLPANHPYEPNEPLNGASLRNTEFTSLRRGPQPHGNVQALPAQSFAPSTAGLERVHAKADALYGIKLNTLARATRNEFSNTAGITAPIIANIAVAPQSQAESQPVSRVKVDQSGVKVDQPAFDMDLA